MFRYDRRGIGDSTGENCGFLSAEADLVAAVGAFRRHAGVERVVGFGNCDAASVLALYGRGAGIDRVLLANPWTIEDGDDLPPAAAIRATYRQRLTSPAAWRRLLGGEIDLAKAVAGLRKAATAPPQGLATRVVGAIRGWGEDAAVVLASGDATAQAYAAVARGMKTETIGTSSHSFAREADQRRVLGVVLNALSSAGGG